MRFHKIANVNKALEYITSKGVKLVSIGAEGRSGSIGDANQLLISLSNKALLFCLHSLEGN